MVRQVGQSFGIDQVNDMDGRSRTAWCDGNRGFGCCVRDVPKRGKVGVLYLVQKQPVALPNGHKVLYTQRFRGREDLRLTDLPK